jgi:predicted enzyme related to lactoylglutathione lyase
MRLITSLAAAALMFSTPGGMAAAQARPAPSSSGAASAETVGVAPQYSSSHVYVAPEMFDRFVASLVATFGGTTSKRGEAKVTPTPSKTLSQLVQTPVGMFSVFGFETPVPYPFGGERSGYLVRDMDAAVAAARAAGADVMVAPFPDPIGRDAIVQWPGGVAMQLYWHTTAPNYAPLKTVPENRVYVSPDRADAFVRAFLAFAHGTLVSDDRVAPGVEIGRAGGTYRRIRLASAFGRIAVLVSDGHLPYPYGRETTGYEVEDLDATLGNASAAGAAVLVPRYSAGGRDAAMIQFPGGYVAEIHAPSRP